MKNLLAKLSGKSKKSQSRSKGTTKRFGSSGARIEQLESRELFVVGANFIAPAVPTNAGFDGVVQVFTPTGSCSGTLLSTGRHVLTAAHCVDFDLDPDGDGQNDRGNGTVDPGNYRVDFDVPGRTVQMTGITAADIDVPDAWTGDWTRNDLAIIELPRLAPMDAERYDIYRGSSEVGSITTFVGYGNSGTGTSTATNRAGHVPDNTKRQGRNIIDSTNNSRLRIDLDNPAGTGDVWREAVSTPGDSGGPAFIGSRIAGVNSTFNIQSQINATTGAFNYGPTGNAYGSFSEFTRVRDYQNWIDDVLDDRFELTIDLDDQPIGNDGNSDVVTMQFNSTTWELEILVNGGLYASGHYSKLRSVDIEGSSDNEYFIVNSVDLWEDVDIDGNGGTDTLRGYGSAYVNRWTITGTNSGSLNNGLQEVNFKSIEALIGGDRTDRFLFSGWGQITGAIYGGAGTDELDYSSSNRAANVDLSESRAAGVGYGAANKAIGFEDVTGSRYSDTIIGNLASNVLKGGDGHDEIRGGGGNDYLYGGDGNDRLFGEDGLDWLFGQDDHDYLDGGADRYRDNLYGGSGNDTFVANYEYRTSGYFTYWAMEEYFADLASGDSTQTGRLLYPSKFS